MSNIEELSLSVRVLNILIRAGVQSIESLENDLRYGNYENYRNFGVGSFEEVVRALNSWKALKAAEQSVHVDAASPESLGALCPHCGNPIIVKLVAPPRQ